MRANNKNLQKEIYATPEYLILFLRNLLLNEKNELHNRNLHISGLLTVKKEDIQNKKVDIESKKVDIQSEKADIEQLLLSQGKDFSSKTKHHILRMFSTFGFDEIFGRSAVVELLTLQNSSASILLSKLIQAGIIEPVSGHGKGKYRFSKKSTEL